MRWFAFSFHPQRLLPMMAIRHRGSLPPHIHLRIQPIISLLAIRQLKNPQPSPQAAIVRRPLTVFSATPRAASSEVQLHGKNSCGQVTHQPTLLTIPFNSNAAGPIPHRAKHCRWQSQGPDRVASGQDTAVPFRSRKSRAARNGRFPCG